MPLALVTAGLRRIHSGGLGTTMRLADGRTFRALLTGAGELELSTGLIEDPRGKAVMEVVKSASNPVITERLEITDTATNQRYKVVQRLNNPTDPYVWRYELKEIVDEVDS